MKRKSKATKKFSLRTTILTFFIFSIVICLLVGIYNFLSTGYSLQEMSRLMSKSRQLSDIVANIDAIQNDLDKYITTRSSEFLQSYYDNRNLVLADAQALEKNVEYNEHGIKLKNLSGLIYNYLKTLDDTINAKRNELTNVYIKKYEEATRDYAYIQDYIKEILNNDLIDSANQYNQMQEDIQIRSIVSYSMFALVLFIIIPTIIVFSYQITGPITKLAGYAKKVSKGDYDVVIKDEATNDEIHQLYGAFNVMVQNTLLYVESLKDKRRLERRLSQEQIKSLEMTNALREAEYLALHSQMNPHFIFNTINIGAKIAMMEEDDIVCEYLENAADVFRYNLSGLKEATLEEEIKNVAAYMNLLKTRFGEKLNYTCEVPENAPVNTFTMPRMTLQPLVENAYVHGVSLCEQGGTIRLEVGKKGEYLQIFVCNTGKEFSSEKVEEILSGPHTEEQPRIPVQPGHISGIGLTNVIKRLCQYFHTDHPIDIRREDGYTKVILTLPLSDDSDSERVVKIENQRNHC